MTETLAFLGEAQPDPRRPDPVQHMAELRVRAGGGDLTAMAELGARLLMSSPLAPEEGLELIRGAAERGGAEGAAILATLAAAGVPRPQSWPEALNQLQRAAELGSKRARRQLIVLAGDQDLASRAESDPDEPGLWPRLAASVNLLEWITAPPRRNVCEAPRIRVVDRFIPDRFCAWLMERARGKLARATMFNPESGRSEYHSRRTNSTFVFDVVEADVTVAVLRARVAAMVKLPTACLEPTQIFHYAEGQEIGPHYDHLERPKMESFAGAPDPGQRVATCLVYLNDDFEGGETEFSRVGFRFKGRRGDALMFANVDPSGAPDKLTLHAGLKPTRGDKWIISQWIHDRPFTAVS